MQNIHMMIKNIQTNKKGEEEFLANRENIKLFQDYF